MDEALILERLDNLSSEIRSMKSNMLEELKQDLGPVLQLMLPKAQQALAEIDGQFDPAELAALVRNLVCNINHLNSALTMMKAGMELKEDLGEVMKISLPKMQEFMGDLHEGEFQAEQLGNLMRTFLLNVQTFSDLMNMLKPMTEFINDAGVVVREADIFSKTNKTLDRLQHCGMMKLSSTVLQSLKEIDCNSEQVEKMCEIIYGLDLKKAEKVTPFGAYKRMKDPKVQEAMGAGFMVLEAVGTMLQTYRQQSAGK